MALRGSCPSQRFSVFAAVNLYSFVGILEYQIGTPFSYILFNFYLSYV